MDAEAIVMFVHIAVVIVTFMMVAVLHTALVQMRRTDRSSDLVVWAPLVRRLEPLVPVGALLILGSGWALVELSDGEFSWSQGWVVVSAAALVVVEAVGAVLIRPRAQHLTARISANGDGPVSQDVRQAILDPVLWYVSHFATVTFFGIVFLMAAKPAGVWVPVTVLVVSAAVGLLTAVPFVRGGGQGTSQRRAGKYVGKTTTGVGSAG